jgi:hypothetical protein
MGQARWGDWFGKNGPFRAESTPNPDPGRWPGLKEPAFQAEDSQCMPNPVVFMDRC